MGSVENLIGEKIYRLHTSMDSSPLDRLGVSRRCFHDGGDPNPDRLLQWARSEYGVGELAAWSLSITIRPPDRYPESRR